MKESKVVTLSTHVKDSVDFKMRQTVKADSLNLRQENDKFVKEILQVCLSEDKVTAITLKPQVEKLQQLLLLMHGFPSERRTVLTELSVTYNLCVLLLNQTGSDIPRIASKTLNRVLGSLNQDSSYDVNSDRSITYLLCYALDRSNDNALLNVLLLLTAVCGVSLMKHGDYNTACEVLREVHVTIQNKRVTNHESSEDIPELVTTPTLVRKDNKQTKANNSSAQVTMATDLPGYSTLVTTLIAGCYVTDQYQECLSLLDSFNITQSDVLLLLVKAKVLLAQDKLDECLETLRQIDDVTSDAVVRSRVYALVGQCFSKQNKVHSAIQQYKMALQLNFTEVQPLYEVSLQYRKLQLHDAELESLNLLVKSMKCQLEEEMKSDPPRAELDVLNHARKFVFSRDRVPLPVAAYRLAKRCLELERHEPAVEKYRDLLKILQQNISTEITTCDDSIPSVVEILHELICALIKAGRLQEAMSLCDKCTQKHSKVSEHPIISSHGIEDINNQQSLNDLVASCITSSSKSADLSSSQQQGSQSGSRKRTRSKGSPSAESPESGDLSCLNEDVVALQYKVDALRRLDRGEEALACLERLVGSLETGLVDRREKVSVSEHTTKQPPHKRTKLDSGAGDAGEQHDNRQILNLLSEAYCSRCEVLIDMSRKSEAIHWSRLAVQSKPDCLDTLYRHCYLLVNLDRLKEAVYTWLPRRGMEPRELDKFQIASLVAKKSVACTQVEELKMSEEERAFTEMDLKLLEHLRVTQNM